MTAITKVFTVIADAAIDPDSPIDQALMTALRDNHTHIREWLGASFFAGAVQDHDHDGLNSKALGGASTTGDLKLTLKTVADTAWVMMNDGSIGNATSAATTRANADTVNLFTLVWNNISNTWAPVQDSTGTPVARGASAAADYAANRRIVLPLTLGRALAISGAGAGLTARALGENLGEETHLLTTAEIPAHTHTINTINNPVSGANVQSAGAGGGGGTPSSNSAGGGGAHNNMQPTSFFNVMVKL